MKNTRIAHYLDEVCEQYPFVERRDVYRILKYFFFRLWYINSKGNDTYVTSRKHKQMFYTGYLTFDPIKRREYWTRKMCKKIRALYVSRKIKWDGYYYFALADSELSKILNQQKSRGRPRKKFTFPNIKLYKILEECLTNEQNKINIFRIPYITSIGFTSIKQNFECDNFEYVYRIVEGGLRSINGDKVSGNNIFNHNYCFLYWKIVE